MTHRCATWFLGLLVVVSLTAGCASAAGERGGSEPTLDRADPFDPLDAYGIGTDAAFESPEPSDTDRAWIDAARRHLGRAVYLQRMRSTFEGTSGRERELARGERYASLDLSSVRETYARIAATEPPLLLTGLGGTAPFDTLAMRYGGKLFPVYYAANDSIDGFLPSPERSKVALFRVSRPNYSGRTKNSHFETVTIEVVDLETFEVTSLETEPLQKSRWVKATWNESSDELYVRFPRTDVSLQDGVCSLAKGSCRMMDGFTPRWMADALERRRLGIKVGRSSSFRLEPLPPRFFEKYELAPKSGRINPMSVRLSPDGRYVSYSTFRSTGVENAHRIEEAVLWLQNLDSGEVRKIATGSHWFHARWLDSERLVYDASLIRTDDYETAIEREVQKLLEKSGGNASEDQRAHLRQMARQKATRYFSGMQWRAPVDIYNIRKGASGRWAPVPQASLAAPFRYEGFIPDEAH